MPPLFTFSSWGMWASAFSSLIWDSSLRVFNSLSTPARPVKNKNTLIKKTQWILINESKNKVYVVQTNEFSIVNHTEQVAFNNYTIFTTFKWYIYLLIQGNII